MRAPSAYSPDGTALASVGEDKTVRVWDVRTGEQISVLLGHGEPVRAVAFSPVDGILASAGFDHQIKLWDYKHGKEIATLAGHANRVQALAISPDGLLLASGSRDAQVKLWRIATGEEIVTFKGHQQRVNSVCFSPHGKTLATASLDGNIKLWDVRLRTYRQTIVQGTPLGSITFSPDGKTLAAGPARTNFLGTCDGTITLWDIESLRSRQICRGHADEIFSLDFSPDGRTLASASADQTVKLWDPFTGQERTTLSSHRTRVYSAKFSPEGSWLASSGENIKLWHSSDARGLWQAEALRTEVQNRLADSQMLKNEYRTKQWPEKIKLQAAGKNFIVPTISPNGQLTAVATAQHTILLCDIDTGKQRLALRGYQAPIEFIAFSADGRHVASASYDNTVRIWRTDNGQLLATFDDHQSRPNCVAFSPDSNMLVTREIEGRMMVRDLAHLGDTSFHDASQPSQVAQKPAVFASLNATAHMNSSKDSRPDKGGVKKDAPRATMGRAMLPAKMAVRVPNRLAGRLTAPLIYSPDGSLLACGANNGEVALWATDTWQEKILGSRHGAMVRTVAFSNNSKLLASGSDDLDQPIILWDLARREPLATLRGHTDVLAALAFSPDDKILASAAGGHDPTVRLWDVPTGRLLMTLVGSIDWLTSLAWSADGQMLVLVDRSGQVLKWGGMDQRLTELATSGSELE